MRRGVGTWNAILLAAAIGSSTAYAQSADAARYKAEASRVTITRDDWGIAHIHGHSDADAVFGMIYAQCEDDFNRVESNYLTSLGRTAEAEGEKAIWADLRQRLFIDPEVLKQDYTDSPEWLRKLMDAWADGINFYLATHANTHPKVLTHFEPWMALSFTEGSIGGDIEKVNLRALQDFYSPTANTDGVPTAETAHDANFESLLAEANGDTEPRGSNGIAIASKDTKNGHALLLINPHTSFFFRSELQMSSDEGLDAYGAATWGQFFIYQGFNERAGWMHTSSNVDAVDEYLDDHHVSPQKDAPEVTIYFYGRQVPANPNGVNTPIARSFGTKQITLTYTTPSGSQKRTFNVYYDHRGPIIRKDGDKWVSIQIMNTPIKALEQSYLRTKAHTYAEYQQTMELMANSSNNTIFADADGDIAYWHGNFIPRRDPKFDYTKPVDGSNPATDWKGLTPLAEVPQLKNPASGWLFNVNDSPWNGAGPSSLKKADYPAYVEQGIESARGVHALRLLTNGSAWTPETLRTAAFDSYLPWFAKTIPALLKAYDALPPNDPQRTALNDQIELLRKWDDRWSADSIATSLAVYWGTEINRTAGVGARRAGIPSEDYIAANATPDALLTALTAATTKLAADFGSWQTPWGNINRFQRLTGDIVQPFNDAGPSIPVPFVSSTWGSLASFGARQYPGTKKWYGTSGNSFVAIVEFGPKVHAVAVTAGGESGHPSDKHFDDEAQRYVGGNLREVYFYPDQLKGHTEKTYHPGE
jgi:acyl-homoserine-lactone acylase